MPTGKKRVDWTSARKKEDEVEIDCKAVKLVVGGERRDLTFSLAPPRLEVNASRWRTIKSST